ncbi:hypothetical protein [Rhizobium laguerreae]|uniref:hypothetical protein n=1 Tax=Rhizobium laguerreae TaxID=1076926 RepID=UPI001C927484|nr:hypothetical protein [Rhizobium laguerreae]MBY3038909.1 hypothetical protein [Rhizobium laguerreae]
MGENRKGVYAALIEMPRRDNGAYLEALRFIRETFAQAEVESGGRVTVRTDLARDGAGSYILTTVIKPVTKQGKRVMTKDQQAPKLFRGFSKDVWKERFQDAGWPADAAGYMALWLTMGTKDSPPDFAEIAATTAKRAE